MHQTDSLETVHSRHKHVDDQQIKAFGLEDLETGPTIVGNVHFEPFIFQDQLNCRAYRPVVVTTRMRAIIWFPQKARVGAPTSPLHNFPVIPMPIQARFESS